MKRFFKKALITLLIVISLTLSACSVNFSDFLGANNTEIVNDIHKKGLLTSNVTIINYNFIGKKLSQGSGVIYKYEDGYYYAITNSHVVYGAYSYQVMDAYGDIWNARVIGSDENYDLAVVQFAINNDNFFYVPELISKDPKVGDKLISIGNPNGIVNTVTFGEVIGYQKLAEFDTNANATIEGTNVEFDVLKHSAPIDSGSSGSAVFNYKYKLCGINFASGRDKEGNYLSSYAIQPTKIIEFLTNNNLL